MAVKPAAAIDTTNYVFINLRSKKTTNNCVLLHTPCFSFNGVNCRQVETIPDLIIDG